MKVRTVMIDGVPHALTFSGEPVRIAAHTGVAFTLNQGEELTVTDPMGEQAAILAAFMAHDTLEWLSGWQTISHADRLYPRKGDVLYSSRSNPMFTIVEDTEGRHDLLLPPSSSARGKDVAVSGSSSCLELLTENLQAFGSGMHAILSTFNIFLNVRADPDTSELVIGLPRSLPGDHIVLRAEQNLVVGLAACSPEQSPQSSETPIDFSVRAAKP
ncbi:MAG: DUF1989 domain-containing protein [Congregibacter sp.]